jgi:hypothetical protein
MNEPISKALIPLIVDLASASTQDAVSLLSTLTSQERNALINLDVWEKDNFSPDSFNNWIVNFCNLPPKLKLEFATSREFALYLKGVFNISTFDIENPDYPDHDDFFITDDNAFLFQFGPHYNYESEIKELLKTLYSEWGVARTYNYLLSIIGVSFYDYQEKLYSRKKEVLSEYGIADHFGALASLVSFKTPELLQTFVKNRKVLPFSISKQLKTQHTLPDLPDQSFFKKLDEVTDPARKDYLKFSLNKLYNDYIIYHKLYRSSRILIFEKSKQIKNCVDLGYSYLATESTEIFKRFDFIDLYKIGKSLIGFAKKKIAKNWPMAFFGETITNFLQLDDPTMLDGKRMPINSYDNYVHWSHDLDEFNKLLPFINKLQQTHIQKQKVIM